MEALVLHMRKGLPSSETWSWGEQACLTVKVVIINPVAYFLMLCSLLGKLEMWMISAISGKEPSVLF